MQAIEETSRHSPETRDFWEALGERRFLIRGCTACGEAHWYPRAICPFCFSPKTEWREGSGRGTIYSWTIMRRAKTPYVIAFVTLEEGPTMLTNLVDCDVETLKIGQEVKLAIRPDTDGLPLPLFTRA